ncbi:MAG: protease modulator HflK [Candidatus Riflebacteria bacterium]
MTRKTSFFLGTVSFLFLAGQAGFTSMHLLLLALLPFLINGIIKKFTTFSSGPFYLESLPRQVQWLIRFHLEKPAPDELDEKDIFQARKLLFVFTTIALLILFTYTFFSLYGVLNGSIKATPETLGFFIFNLVINIVLLAIIRYERRLIQQSEVSQNEEKLLCRLRFMNFFILASMLNLVLQQGLNYLGEELYNNLRIFQITDGIFIGLAISVLFISFEALIGMLRRIRSMASFSGNIEPIEESYLIRAFFAEESFGASLSRFSQDLLGLDLKQSRVVVFLFSVFEPAILFSTILAWLLTSFVIVGPDEAGIIYRFGSMTTENFAEPGITTKLPWPFGEYRLIKKDEVRIANIGFEPVKGTNHIIWTKSHAKENFNLVAGDGLELISIDCQIMYKIDQVRDYLMNYQNPDELLTAAAYRFLTRETVCSSFDSIMGRDRREFAETLKDHIQKELDEKKTGVRIVKIVFLAMHPPIEVAPVFEDVISAQIDKNTSELAALTESIHNRHMHKAFAAGEIFAAKGQALTSIAEATGQGQAFISQSIGFNAAPDLSKFRLKLESLQKLVENKKLFVIDPSLLRPSDRLILRIAE